MNSRSLKYVVGANVHHRYHNIGHLIHLSVNVVAHEHAIVPFVHQHEEHFIVHSHVANHGIQLSKTRLLFPGDGIRDDNGLLYRMRRFEDRKDRDDEQD